MTNELFSPQRRISGADRKNYTLSLIALCAAEGMLDEEAQLRIKTSLDSIFTENASRLVKRSSSTLPMKTAEKIYSSVLYCCDAFLLGFGDDNEAAKRLCSMKTEDIYEAGAAAVTECFNKTREVFRAAYKLRIDTALYEYQYVMKQAYDRFYSSYSAVANASDICASIDYPLMHKKAYELESTGAFFMLEYYTALKLENEFCAFFGHDDIEAALKKFGKCYGSDYRGLVFNIAEVLWTDALSCSLAGLPPFTVRVNKRVTDRLKNINPADLEELVGGVFELYRQKTGSGELSDYLEAYLPEYILRIGKGIKSGCIERML